MIITGRLIVKTVRAGFLAMRGPRLFNHADWKSKKTSARTQMPYKKNKRAVCCSCLVLMVDFQKKGGLRDDLFVMRPLIFSGP